MTDFDIRKLDPGDVDAIDRLMKANSATLGFLPREALLAYLREGWALGAECPDGSLAAYILFANRRKRDVRVVHVCVCRELRGRHAARGGSRRGDGKGEAERAFAEGYPHCHWKSTARFNRLHKAIVNAYAAW